MKKVIVIGSGFAGLSAAACLASRGLDVTVLEKNGLPGGRARRFKSQGFTFDMGPSWYWMPDVFENYFQRFGKTTAHYYDLRRLDPSYRIYFGRGDSLDVPAAMSSIYAMFDRLEPGSSRKLDAFLRESAYRYAIGMGDLVYKPALSWRDLTQRKLLVGTWKLNLARSHSSYVRSFFKHPRLISLLEFPVLFLGAAPSRIPALYSLMNYADLALGTWYPMGGMFEVVNAMVKLAKAYGAKFRYNTSVSGIAVDRGAAYGVWHQDTLYPADFVVAGADYRHVEHDLLEKQSRSYSDAYWATRLLAPSCLIFFVGINKRVNSLLHHTLFFDEDFQAHVDDIYKKPRWPAAPQFYVCCPSKTDPTVSPPGSENLFILVPVAPGLPDGAHVRNQYFASIMKRMETILGESLLPHVAFMRSYAHNDFSADYNAFRGNAYGLANTLFQTANFKPRIRSKRVNNLFFTGQLTVPGPGVPPAIISGQVAATSLLNYHENNL